MEKLIVLSVKRGDGIMKNLIAVCAASVLAVVLAIVFVGSCFAAVIIEEDDVAAQIVKAHEDRVKDMRAVQIVGTKNYVLKAVDPALAVAKNDSQKCNNSVALGFWNNTTPPRILQIGGYTLYLRNAYNGSIGAIYDFNGDSIGLAKGLADAIQSEFFSDGKQEGVSAYNLDASFVVKLAPGMDINKLCELYGVELISQLNGTTDQYILKASDIGKAVDIMKDMTRKGYTAWGEFDWHMEGIYWNDQNRNIHQEIVLGERTPVKTLYPDITMMYTGPLRGKDDLETIPLETLPAVAAAIDALCKQLGIERDQITGVGSGRMGTLVMWREPPIFFDHYRCIGVVYNGNAYLFDGGYTHGSDIEPSAYAIFSGVVIPAEYDSDGNLILPATPQDAAEALHAPLPDATDEPEAIEPIAVGDIHVDPASGIEGPHPVEQPHTNDVIGGAGFPGGTRTEVIADFSDPGFQTKNVYDLEGGQLISSTREPAPVLPVSPITRTAVNDATGESEAIGPIAGGMIPMMTYLVSISRESDTTKTFGSVEEAKAALEAATGSSVNLNLGGANGTNYVMGMGPGSAFFTYDTNEDGTVKVYLKNDVQPLGSREIKHIDWANYSWPGVERPFAEIMPKSEELELGQRKDVEAQIEMKGIGKNYTVSSQMAATNKETLDLRKKQQ
jgi:hypothetical protein